MNFSYQEFMVHQSDTFCGGIIWIKSSTEVECDACGEVGLISNLKELK